MDETNLNMNDLSELLVSSTTDTISAQPIKLSELLINNTAVRNELEKQKLVLEQLHSNVQRFTEMITSQEDTDLVKGKIRRSF
jgi:hypothetical protein